MCPAPLTPSGLPGKAVLGWTHSHRRPPLGRVGHPCVLPASLDLPHIRGDPRVTAVKVLWALVIGGGVTWAGRPPPPLVFYGNFDSDATC